MTMQIGKSESTLANMEGVVWEQVALRKLEIAPLLFWSPYSVPVHAVM